MAERTATEPLDRDATRAERLALVEANLPDLDEAGTAADLAYEEYLQARAEYATAKADVEAKGKAWKAAQDAVEFKREELLRAADPDPEPEPEPIPEEESPPVLEEEPVVESSSTREAPSGP